MTGLPRALFDPDKVTDTSCPVPWCGAIRLAGQDKVITCAHELDPEHRRRPKGCLNTYRPEHTPIPF